MQRREFIQTTAGLASGMLLLNSKAAFGYQANSAVRMALLGCGNRGTHVATSFSQNTVAQVVALADLFQDQLDAGHAHFNEVNAKLGRAAIDSKLLFRGPHAFEQLAASFEVDMIQISTPPFFHVEHLGAAVAAGKHVYCEKPVGIDVKQTKQALEISKKVRPTQSVDVGFQCRMAPPIAAIADKIKAGALGKIASITAYCRRRPRRVPPAQLALGPRALRRHPRRAEHSHHRPLQLDSRRASAQGRCNGRPQHPHPRRRLLGQLPGRLPLSQRHPRLVRLQAVWRLRHVRSRPAPLRF